MKRFPAPMASSSASARKAFERSHKIVLVFVLVGTLTGLFVAYSVSAGRVRPGGSLRSSSPATTPEPKEIPDHVKFSFVFHHLENIKERAASLSSYRGRMGLTDREFEQVRDIAREHEVEVGELDRQAQTIIAEYHKQYPPGAINPGTVLPPPPAELRALQERRDATSLRYGERLRAVFGDAKDEKLKAFLDREFPAKDQQPNHGARQVNR